MTQNTNSVSFSLGQFQVKPLAEFKSIDLNVGELLVRKIEKGTGKQSLGAIVKSLGAVEVTKYLENDVFFGAVISYANSLVEECCKKKITSGANLLVESDYNLESILEFLAEQEISEGRISKDKISQWFSSQVASVVTRLVKEKYSQISGDKLVEIVALYKKNFECFAKREHSFNSNVWNSIAKVLENLQDSAMKEFCTKKLESFKEKSVDDFAL